MIKNYTNNIGIVIQARMNSKRLPGKVTKNFLGEPLIIYKINLIRKLGVNLPIIVAMSDNKSDDGLAKLCEQKNVNYFRGPEENVFKRFKLLLYDRSFETIVRLTADNPLTKLDYLIEGINLHQKFNSDITTTRKIDLNNQVISFVPKGLSFDIIKAKHIIDADIESLNDFEKEHIIPYFFNKNFNVSYVKDDSINASFTIDTINEFQNVEKYCKKLIDDNNFFDFLGKKL